MSIRAVLVLAACLQVALANPFWGYNTHAVPSPCAPPPCHAPPPCVKVVEVPYPVLEQVNVPVPAPVPVPVIAPTITETWTRLAGTTSGNGGEQKVITTSAPAPPVALPLPTAPCAPPCGAPLAGADFLFNANAPALALGASPLALNNGFAYNGLLGSPYVNEVVAAPAYNGLLGAGFGNGLIASPVNYGYNGYNDGYYGPYVNEILAAPVGLGYNGLGYNGLGYNGLGYNGLGYNGLVNDVIATPLLAGPANCGYNGLIASPVAIGVNPIGHGYQHGWY